jgi:cell division protein FtsB
MDGDFYRRKKKRLDPQSLFRKLIRNKRAMLALIVGLPVLLYIFFGPRGIVQRIRLQAQKTELETKIREAQMETQRLQAESKALEGDRKAIEKVAREKYNMVREGETVYRVNKPK